MGWIKDHIEDLTEFVDTARTVAEKASAKAWSRVLLMAITGILVMGSYLFYLSSLIGDYGKNTDSYLTEYNVLQKESRTQRALDYINVCIDAIKGTDINKDYYCQNAVSLYKDAYDGLPNKDAEENVNRSAYGAMKVEMATKLRTIAHERLDKKSPKMDDKLTFMISLWGVALACLAGILAMALTVFITHRMSKTSQP